MLALKQRIIHSPTIMTWSSYFTKALTLLGILPLILRQLNVQETALWGIFASYIALLSVADFGFRATFSRLITYVHQGVQNITDLGIIGSGQHTSGLEMNQQLLNQIVYLMKKIYLVISLFLIVVLGIFGTISLHKIIGSNPQSQQYWLSWIITYIGCIVSFYCKIYLNVLEGFNKIALVRRVETVTNLLAIVFSIIALIFIPSLLLVVIITQFWILVASFRDIYLCYKLQGVSFKLMISKTKVPTSLFKIVWRPAWRTGISGIMSNGILHLSPIVYAQFAESKDLSAYLLAIRLINQVREVAMAPFYSKLPVFASLRVHKKMSEFIALAKKSMFLSHATYLVAFTLITVSINPLLQTIGSKTEFVSFQLWLLIGAAYFVHRYAAMHIQLYLTTNHVISHIADGISGTIIIALIAGLASYLKVYAIPLSMLIAYSVFYSGYALYYSLKSMNQGFIQFEKRTVLLVGAFVFIFITINFLNLGK